MRQLLYSMLVTEGDQAAQKVCTYLHIYIHMYVYICTNILTYILYILMCVHTYIHAHILCFVLGQQTFVSSVYLEHLHSVHASSMLWCLCSSPHSRDPPPVQTLVDIFSHMRRAGGESPELTSLVTYLAFLKNANEDTADRLHSLVKDNNDPLLLTLGSLAEYAPKDVSGSSTTP